LDKKYEISTNKLTVKNSLLSKKFIYYEDYNNNLYGDADAIGSLYASNLWFLF
jgi:hypothetical protein